MHSFKSCTAVFAVVVIAAVQPVRAVDTPEDIQLREFLRKSMTGGTQQSTPATPAPPTAQAPAAKPPVAPAPAPKVTPPPAPPAPAAAAVTPAPAAPVTATPVVVTQESSSTSTVGSLSTEDTDQLRQLLRKQDAMPAPAVTATPAAPTAAAAEATPAASAAPAPRIATTRGPADAPAPAPVSVEPAKTGYAPMVAPALPVTTSQQDRLATLLQLYRTDVITAEEYHKQRAAILAGQ